MAKAKKERGLTTKQEKFVAELTKKNEKKAKTQANGASPISGTVPPKDKQFGKPNGNKQGHGFFKKEDTLRYKWEKMLEMDDDELLAIKDNPKSSRVEKMTAEVLLDRDMKSAEKLASLEKLANQVYGMPRQEIKQTNIEVPAPRLPKNKTEE